jgi:SAM-dependent methyltransferase
MHTLKYKLKLSKTRKNINKIYENKSGYMYHLDGYKDHHTTYGEITQEGIEKLVEYFNKQPIMTYEKNRRTFYDLGSGIGKNVIVVASLVPEINSKGIEIVKERHDLAINAYHSFKNKAIKNRVEFICASFMDVKLGDAAWIYLSNLCFSEKLNKQISDKLNKEVGKHTLIACSKQLILPKKDYSMETITIPMSWDSHSNIVLYRKLV